MKVFFGAVLAVFVLFLGACVAGFFMPNTLIAERSIIMEAHVDDVFPYLEDLEQYRNWSALDATLGDSMIITGGAESGTGQTQAWQNGPTGFEFGSREIAQSQIGEFVQLHINIAGQDASTTHAIVSNEDDTVTVLTKLEMAQPGFPYISRLRSLKAKPSYEASLDKALQRLKVQVEANL